MQAPVERNKQAQIWFSIGCAITVLLIALVMSDALPTLRGPLPDTNVWHWKYILRPASRWLWSIAAAAALIGLTYIQLYHRRLPASLFVVLTIIFGFLLQLGVVYADNSDVFTELVNRTLATQTNGYLREAVDRQGINLASYPETMPTFASEHLRTKPPMTLLLHLGSLAIAQQLPDSWLSFVQPAVIHARCADLWVLAQDKTTHAAIAFWAFLPLLLGLCTAAVAYPLTRRRYDESIAIVTTPLLIALPSIQLFSPTPDQILAFLSVCIIWLVLRTPKTYSFSLVVAGLLVGIGGLMSLGQLAIGLILLLLVVTTRSNGIWQLLVVGASALALWLLLAGVTGINLLHTAQVALAQHYELVTNVRSYWRWLAFNWVDVLVFVGPLLLLGLSVGARRRDWLAIGILLTWLLLTLSGSTRGEIGRIWLFIMPFAAIAGGANLFKSLSSRSSVAILLTLQLSLTVALGISWRVVEADIVIPTPPAPSTSLPQHERVNLLFENGMSLVGFQHETVSASEQRMTLLWQMDHPQIVAWTVFNHLLDDAGAQIGQQDSWPSGGSWPPTCWHSAEIVVDTHTISHAESAQPAAWRVGLYNNQTGQRVSTADGSDFLLIPLESQP